jgi:hypothetical protein
MPGFKMVRDAQQKMHRFSGLWMAARLRFQKIGNKPAVQSARV